MLLETSKLTVRVLAAIFFLEICAANLLAQMQLKANDLLRQMTLEEKIGQLSQMPGFPVPEFMQQNGIKPEDAVRKYDAGSVRWVSDPKEINRWQHIVSMSHGCTFQSYLAWM